LIGNILRPLTGQSAHEAAVSGKVFDSVAAGGITGSGVSGDLQGATGVALDSYQIYGGGQTIILSTSITVGLYGTGATLSSAGALIILPLALTSLGSIEIGFGLNELYEDVFDNSLGSDIYDWLNPKTYCF
jgi:hypothetical protein